MTEDITASRTNGPTRPANRTTTDHSRTRQHPSASNTSRTPSNPVPVIGISFMIRLFPEVRERRPTISPFSKQLRGYSVRKRGNAGGT
ncbi:hypothetical protein ABZ714_01190 [Streptomyces sp. NPDC006798]|uniref:hypothetical protein n=1 Tax=Streptomyces sp. NPDC006798 TaxID=3155462 RepID=UPI0033C76F3E